MLRTIFYKEWLKIKKIWWLSLAGNMAACVYLFISIRHMFSIEHAEMLFYQYFEIGTIHYGFVKYLVLATGLILGTAQFAPEMINHRFRLALHLPIRPGHMVTASVIMGLLSVLVIGMVDALMLFVTMQAYYPTQAATSALLTALPWFFSGLVAYTGAALVILEPAWPRKIVCLAITAGFIWIFFQGKEYESFNQALAWPMAISLLFIPAVLLPAHRYRNRRA